MAQHNDRLESDVTTHFGFGKNWSDYAESITEVEIREAENGLLRLVPADEISGHTFLDIGCGSGLHSLAALRQGASSVTAFDFDPLSVQTTEQTLERFAPGADFNCRAANILADHTELNGPYDIVYSWGVLHHTGNMWKAIDNAIQLVSQKGKLVIAIYVKTPFCGFWAFEKKIYTALPRLLRFPFIWIYAGLCILSLLARGKNPISHIAKYNQERGMSWYRDRIDWLGGYPYESATAEEITEFVEARGGRLEKSSGTSPSIGLLGSGCAEYVFTMGDRIE